MGNRLSLKIFKGGEEIGTEIFDREIIKIGRLASAHLKLDDPKVSRIHAVIEVSRAGQDISIIDMGSAEGTFVNGEKVTKVKLKDGDEIRLGDTRLQLGLQGDGSPAAAAAGDTTGLVHEKSNGELQALASLQPPPDDGDVFQGETVDMHGVTPAQPTVIPQAQPQPQARPPAASAVVSSMPALAAMSPVVASPPPMAAPVQQQAGLANQAFYATDDEDSGMSLGYGGGGVPAVQYAPSQPVEYGEAPIIWYSEYNEIPDIKIEPESAVTQTNRAIEVAVLWGDQVLTVKHFKAPKKPVTMGEHDKADIFVTSEGLPDPLFPLIRYMDGEYVLTYCDAFQGTVSTPEKLTPLKELKGSPDGQHNRSYNYPLPTNSVTNIEYAGMTLQLQFVPPPAIVAASPFANINYNWLNVFLISAFAHIGIFTTAALYPYDTKSLEEDLLSSPNRFAQFLLNAPEKKKAEVSKLIGKEGEASAKHAGSEGKAGKKDAKDTGKRMATKTDKPTNEMVVANKLAQLFGKDGAGGGVGTIFGGALGGELVGAIGGVTGEQIGDSFGFGGLGMRGHGPGGGGTSTSTFGVGSIGTRGRGGGSAGYGSGAGGLGGKADHGIRISQGTPVIMGSLDKEIIRRVIKENLSQIRYCYERELTKSPGLFGKIQVKFIIAATGLVSNSQIEESTMKNANVEQCIAQKVRGWRFPKPKGGGIVIVTYPFIFKQSG